MSDIRRPDKQSDLPFPQNFGRIRTIQIPNPLKVENFLFNGIILGWFALQNIFISEKFYCWNPDGHPGNVTKEEILASLATNKDWDIHGRASSRQTRAFGEPTHKYP